MTVIAPPTPDPHRLERLERLADRQEILDCLHRFARGMDRFDRTLFLSAFHPDAIIDAGPFVGEPLELYEWASNLHAQGQEATQHLLLNHTGEITGDTAHTETYYLYVGKNRDGTNWIAGGRYINRFDRRDGEWRIAVHCNTVEWSSLLEGLPNPFAAIPDLAANGEARRDRDDISYRRPLHNRRNPQIPAARD